MPARVATLAVCASLQPVAAGCSCRVNRDHGVEHLVGRRSITQRLARSHRSRAARGRRGSEARCGAFARRANKRWRVERTIIGGGWNHKALKVNAHSIIHRALNRLFHRVMRTVNASCALNRVSIHSANAQRARAPARFCFALARKYKKAHRRVLAPSRERRRERARRIPTRLPKRGTRYAARPPSEGGP